MKVKVEFIEIKIEEFIIKKKKKKGEIIMKNYK